MQNVGSSCRRDHFSMSWGDPNTGPLGQLPGGCSRPFRSSPFLCSQRRKAARREVYNGNTFAHYENIKFTLTSRPNHPFPVSNTTTEGSSSRSKIIRLVRMCKMVIHELSNHSFQKVQPTDNDLINNIHFNLTFSKSKIFLLRKCNEMFLLRSSWLLLQ